MFLDRVCVARHDYCWARHQTITHPARLEAEVREAVTAAAAPADAERSLGQERNARVSITVGPMLDALVAVSQGSDDAFKRLIELTQTYAGQPMFCTVEEFDR